MLRRPPRLRPPPPQSYSQSLHTLRKRQLHATLQRAHGYAESELDPATAIPLTVIDRDGKEHAILAPPGKSLLEVAHANDIDLEGACEGSLACSTCHVYLDQASFEKLEDPCDDENDMLDLAFGLSEEYVYTFIREVHQNY